MNSTKEFFDYLLYIGIVSNDTLEFLKSIVKKKTNDNKNNTYINKNLFMKSLIGEYLSSLNKDDLNKLGGNIYEKYVSNKTLTISKHLLKLFRIIENKLFYKTKSFFDFWKNSIFNGRSPRPNYIKRSKSTDKLFNINKKNNNIYNLNNIYNNNNSNNNYNHISNENFISRLNEYNIKKENEIKKGKIRTEDDLGAICTFSPNLSLTKKINNKFRRKYDIYKQNSIEQTEKCKEKQKKKVDIIRMNKLYNDYQRKNENYGELKRIIEEENGITFSPKVNVNSPYNKNIKDTFHERNQKLLKSKKDFVKGFNLLRELQMKGVDISKFTQEN